MRTTSLEMPASPLTTLAERASSLARLLLRLGRSLADAFVLLAYLVTPSSVCGAVGARDDVGDVATHFFAFFLGFGLAFGFTRSEHLLLCFLAIP